MKRLKAGSVNSISFIRNISYTINSFDVTFEKVVGGTVLTLSDIQDELGLAVCADFIVLSLDLVSNTIDGGEYYMTVTNEGSSTTYLCEVQSYQYNTHGSSIYSDSVVLSNDVDPFPAVEYALNPVASQSFANEQVKIFVADSLSDAQQIEPNLNYGTNVLGSGTTHDLSELISGAQKLYAYSEQGGSYIYWVGTTVVSNPNSATNIPFTADMEEPHYETVELIAGEVKEINAFGTDAMFPVLLGLNGADVLISAAITKLDYVKGGNYIAIYNSFYEVPNYQYSRQPAWVNNSDYDSSQSGARVAFYAASINDDV